MKRVEIRDRALLVIAESYFGWGTDDALDISDQAAEVVKLALIAAYAVGTRAPISSVTGKRRS